MRKRLGCLTTSGIVTALIAVLAVIVAALVSGGTLFSPGRLNARAGETTLGGVRSHNEIGGRCSACHPAPWSGDTIADRCLVCHTEIQAQLSDPATLHGALLAGRAARECVPCHTEHQGPEAELTIVDPDRFPHEATGYSLQGHQQTVNGALFVCNDCHGSDLSRFDQAACAACHREMDPAYMQRHQADFGTGCLACHDGVDTYGQAFDHNQGAFPLVGAHDLLPCSGCHQNARTPAELQAAPRDCYACHREDDAHQGQFGQDCAACHTPEDWQQATFDHAQTAFPLTGRHSGVECRECHVDGVYKGTPRDCYACHREDDAHQGQFGQDCAACHTPEDWRQATFDHAQTAFPLTGRHSGVECRECHTGGVFAGTPQMCVACHEDPVFHAGLLGADCAGCHSTDGWLPARYDRNHPFPINHGEGGPNPCQTCHPDRLQVYTCYDCHEHDPAEIASEHRDEGILDFEDCVRCHPTGQKDEAEGEGDDD